MFAGVMDKMTDEVMQESLWIMMFANNIVRCSESREKVEERLERRTHAPERIGMKFSRSKTEHMCMNRRQFNSDAARSRGSEGGYVQRRAPKRARKAKDKSHRCGEVDSV